MASRFTVESGQTRFSSVLDITCHNTIPSWRKFGNGELKARFEFNRVAKTVAISIAETAFADPTSSKRKNQKDQTIKVALDLNEIEGRLVYEYLKVLYG
jgi:hypothetical protein